MLRFARKLGIEIGIFCALHTCGRQLGQHPHIHLSVTCGGLSLKHAVWRSLYFKKKVGEQLWRIAVFRLLRKSYDRINPAALLGYGHLRDERQWGSYLQAQYRRHWKVHFAKKIRGAWCNVKYIGRYLKRQPVGEPWSISITTTHAAAPAADTEPGRDDGRYISHIPARHFKMVWYYGFLANRKRRVITAKSV